MKKKIIAIVLCALLLVTMIPVYASGQPVTVTNYDDLYVAVESASDGDTIIIADVIPIEWGIYLGDASKTITLQRSGNGCIELKNDMGEYWNIFFVNLIFDCQGVDSDQFLVNHADNIDVFMENCTFINTETVEQPEPTQPSEPDDAESQEGTEDQEGSDTGKETEPSEQGDPDDGTEEGDHSQDQGNIAPSPNPPIEPEIDKGTQEAPPTETKPPQEQNPLDSPAQETDEAQKDITDDSQEATQGGSDEQVINDTFTDGNDTQGLPDSTQDIPDSSVQTVPVYVTVDSDQPQQTLDSGTGNLAVNVNGQPVILPDGSGTATINTHIETSKEQTGSGQTVKSESLTGTSEPIVVVVKEEPSQAVKDEGVDVLQIIQIILLACILGFLIGSKRSRKDLLDIREEKK